MFLMLLASAGLFLIAYLVYGRYLARWFGVDPSRPTPSHTDYDGVDRVPAHKAVLLGHHFSSIAGAGPIVGPIVAAVAFGWAPTLIWVVLGAILIGGVHDFGALFASVRHRARSIAEIAREHMSPLAYKLLLIFIWLALIYVLTVFTDLTAATFVNKDPAGEGGGASGGGGVATSAILFMLLAIGFGLAVYRFKLRVLWASLIFVPLVFVAIWLGQQIPIEPEFIARHTGLDPAKVWDVFLIAYCFVASTTPVWILLQPRDYLSSFLLYSSVVVGLAGILLGGFQLQYPGTTGWADPKLGALFPMLFITVACGACSGFHSIVASGTSSKQINNESDARVIGYGAMLIEGLVAVIAICTVAMLPKGDALCAKEPLVVYGTGMGNFVRVLGIDPHLGYAFGLLALSTFILTTLDTATRLGRYVLEEFFNLKETRWRYLSTAATLVLPTIFVLITLRNEQGQPTPAWKLIWPVFGATNQLLAGLVLLVIAVWLRKTGRKSFFAVGPMLFMNIMTIWALVLLLGKYRFHPVGIIAAVLLVLAVILIVEGIRTVTRTRRAAPPA